MIKPIETVYKGYRFRSRLEARWAVYFDAIGIDWEYEKEGYDLGDGFYYLPDFWLPQVNMWGEVKPIDFSSTEIEKVERLVRGTGKACLLLVGLPDTKTYDAVESIYPPCDDILPPYDLIRINYLLTMYHNYPVDEGRFYCMPGECLDTVDDFYLNGFDDIPPAVDAAKQARFEHGEQG